MFWVFGLRVRLTLETGNEFIVAVNALTAQFSSEGSIQKTRSFDIRGYQIALAELSNFENLVLRAWVLYLLPQP